MDEPTLHRTLGWPAITLYGLGTILGAGVYVVTGEVAAHAGAAAPLSFLLAGGVAALCGLAFGDLCARLPESAGEAVYVQAAFGLRALSTATGLAVAATGVVSAAAIANGVTGYLGLLVDLPDAAAITVTVVALGAIAAAGIRVSAGVAAALTAVEVLGLLLVIGGAAPAAVERWGTTLRAAGAGGIAPHGIVTGAFLAFYAFIGFEDMVNQAEEVRSPRRTLPWALLAALAAATVLYLAVALVSVAAVEPAALAASDRPLALVFERATGRSPLGIGMIGLVAVGNGALVQIVMGARVLYGLSRRGWLPAVVGRVDPRTRTPLVATAGITAVVLALALALDLSALARITSGVILTVFALVNLALARIARREPRSPGPWSLPWWLPLGTALLIAAFLAMQLTGIPGLGP